MKSKHLAPLRSIRKYCLWCMNNKTVEVRLCPSIQCPLYPFRFGKRGKSPLTPTKAIKKRCLDCGEPTIYAVKDCIFNGGIEDLCTLYPYRLGKNPHKKGNVSALTPYLGKKGVLPLGFQKKRVS